MSADRPISGADVHAVLRTLGPGAYEADLAEAWIAEDDLFSSVEAIEAALPARADRAVTGGVRRPARPLFGEFE